MEMAAVRGKALNWETISVFATRQAVDAHFTPQHLATRGLHWGNSTASGPYSYISYNIFLIIITLCFVM